MALRVFTTVLEAAILIGLGAFRLSYMLSVEDGPQDIFKRLRRRLGVPDEGWVSDDLVPLLITCILCLSVWMTAAVALLWWIEPWIVVVLAAMTVALGANRWLAPTP